MSEATVRRTRDTARLKKITRINPGLNFPEGVVPQGSVRLSASLNDLSFSSYFSFPASRLLLTFVVEVVDVGRAGHSGQQARRSTRPADETVPLGRTRFI